VTATDETPAQRRADLEKVLAGFEAELADIGDGVILVAHGPAEPGDTWPSTITTDLEAARALATDLVEQRLEVIVGIGRFEPTQLVQI
jgi:hypothetical protein